MGPYHPCKVIAVLKSGKDVTAADDSVQLVVEAWDEAQWCISLADKLKAEKPEEGDIVLADWSSDGDTKTPKMQAVKIIRGKKADEVWKAYKSYLKKLKEKQEVKAPQQPQQTYMG